MTDYTELAKEVHRAWSRQRPPKIRDIVADNQLASGHARDTKRIGWDEQSILEIYAANKSGRRFDDLDCGKVVHTGGQLHLMWMTDAARAYYIGGVFLCLAREFLPGERPPPVNETVDQIEYEIRRLVNNPHLFRAHWTQDRTAALVHVCQALIPWSRKYCFKVYGVEIHMLEDLLQAVESLGLEVRAV